MKKILTILICIFTWIREMYDKILMSIFESFSASSQIIVCILVTGVVLLLLDVFLCELEKTRLKNIWVRFLVLWFNFFVYLRMLTFGHEYFLATTGQPLHIQAFLFYQSIVFTITEIPVKMLVSLLLFLAMAFIVAANIFMAPACTFTVPFDKGFPVTKSTSTPGANDDPAN